MAVVLVGLGVLGAAAYAATVVSTPTKPAASGGAPKPVPVAAVKAIARDVPIILRGLGTVTAYNSVALRSRVEGAITQVNFREGQLVHAGDLLIQLDPRPYEAALTQAKANLARDQATLGNAKTDLARYADLLKRNFAPEKQVTTQQTTVSQSEAAVQSDTAMVQAAQLNVDYAALRSPIDGVTGIRQVDIGNLIQANNQQSLVTITQIQPIYVIFTLPEVNIGPIRDAMAQGTLSIQAFDSDDQKMIAEGKLDLIDNMVDPNTGTVKLKAEFANADRALWPGQFVNAHAVLRIAHDGVTIPSDAVLTGPKGTFTYVVDPDSKVALRPLKIVQTESNMALVGSGLKAGETVVTVGQFRLQPGSTVRISDQFADVQRLSDAPAGTDAAK